MSGKLADYFGASRLLVVGIIFLIIGLFMLGNLGSQLSIATVVIPLIIVSIANSIAWPSLAKTVLSATPKEHIGSASGMFYTINNVGRSLSQTLAIMLIEFSIPPAIVSKAIIGIGDSNDLHVESDLVRSIDSSFRFFTIFFAIALILSLVLLKSKGKNNVEN